MVVSSSPLNFFNQIQSVCDGDTRDDGRWTLDWFLHHCIMFNTSQVCSSVPAATCVHVWIIFVSCCTNTSLRPVCEDVEASFLFPLETSVTGQSFPAGWCLSSQRKHFMLGLWSESREPPEGRVQREKMLQITDVQDQILIKLCFLFCKWHFTQLGFVHLT